MERWKFLFSPSIRLSNFLQNDNTGLQYLLGPLCFFSENVSVSEPNMIFICSHHLWFFPLTLLLFPMKCTVHSSWSTWCWWYDWITLWRIVFLFVLWSFLSCQPHFLRSLFWISQNRLLTLLIFVYIENSNMNCISVIAANSFWR